MFVHAGAVYRQALTPEQKAKKKDYLLEQALRSQPTWDEIWEEIKERESEWERYIKQEAIKLHPRYEEHAIGTRGLTVPHVPLPEEMVEEEMERLDPQMWKAIQRKKDKGNEAEAERLYGRLWAHAYAKLDDEKQAEIEALKEEAEEIVKAEAYTEYKRLQNHLKRLEGKDCYRAVMVKREVDPVQLDQLGVYWTVDYEAAQPYYANRPDLWKTRKILIYRGRIDPTYVDWKGTAGARFIEVYGEREAEIRFFKHAPIYIQDVQVYSDPDNWYKQREPNEVLPIRNYRRC